MLSLSGDPVPVLLDDTRSVDVLVINGRWRAVSGDKHVLLLKAGPRTTSSSLVVNRRLAEGSEFCCSSHLARLGGWATAVEVSAPTPDHEGLKSTFVYTTFRKHLIRKTAKLIGYPSSPEPLIKFSFETRQLCLDSC